MTSGTWSKSENYGNYSARTWNGGNGKYYVVGGRKRSKWNNYTMTEYAHTSSHSSYPTGGPYYINVGAAGGTTETDLPGYANVALQAKLTSKIRGHDFNIGVAAAEADKTTKMIVDNVANIGRALLDIKHGNVADAARRLGINNHQQINLGKKITQNSTRELNSHDISGRWLELQYGWLPLLSDVHEAAQMLKERTSGPRISTVHTSKSVTRSYNGSASPTNWSGQGEYTITKHYWYEMTEQLSNQRSLGLTHPLSIAWEIMPYSFVLDWFLPVGSYLDNLAVIPSLTGRQMTMIVREWTAVGAGTSKFYLGASAQYHKVVVSRTIGSINLATPSFKSFTDAASGKHIANAVALAHQLLRK
jgi:hypothetical protein